MTPAAVAQGGQFVTLMLEDQSALCPDRARSCTGLFRTKTSLMLVLGLNGVLTLAWDS